MARTGPSTSLAAASSPPILPWPEVRATSIGHAGILIERFTPEFRNRLDSIVQFAPLDTGVIRTVVDKFLIELQTQLDDKKVAIHVDDAAIDWFVAHGYDKAMGARPMLRLVQNKIKKPLAEDILFGKLMQGGDVHVTVRNDDIRLEISPAVGSASQPRDDADLTENLDV